ncbi:hypothetical protein EMPS_00236 [Entomortierella parvispora]|uniref:Myb-like domain-containing protein n=1 Tax=Entomortierella parvispora TaxID=205924 RepID=A0A9P3H051_9FUNG|nr:hypothetical protein EMPS_00236 [Entomortierella parvispora]
MPLDHHLQGLDKDSSSSSSSPHAGSSPDLHMGVGHQYQVAAQQRSPVKSRPKGSKPWSKSEQESLYIAVERLGLFGQWELVQQRMNLDRSPTEIQNEYTRIYAELPNTDDEEDADSDADFQDERPEDQSQEERNLELELEWRLAQRLDGSSISSSSNGARTREIECSTASAARSLATPALTATSSTPSARSSQDNIAQLYDQSKRPERFVFPGVTRKITPEEDEDVEEEEDEEEQEQEEDDQVSKKDEKLHVLPTISSASISTETRPPRMIRVWTPEQSENLKNLIEVSFPGSYRINWVWVAAQMGNAFTRKQCKNKWEIMRRRMGTEDEIQLLKRGYQEFGPSWGQIQEKYLPERSRGGISIMWDLLESRGTEQQGHHGSKHLSHRRGVSMSSTTAPYPRPSLHSSTQEQCQDTFRRTRTATSDSAVDQGSRQLMKGRLQATIGRHRASSSLDMSDTLRFGTMTSREQGHHHPIGPGGVSETTVTGARSLSRPPVHVHKRHGSETWIDRSLPMTWTEPLSKQLEELVQRHFPHPQKVNWAKISALMGTNPIVSREQCKRRWYLISQSHQQSHLSAHLPYTPLHQQLSPQRRPLHQQQQHSHQTGFVGPRGPLQAPMQSPDCYAMDIDGHY